MRRRIRRLDLRAAAAAVLAGQRDRWILWVPLAAAGGAAAWLTGAPAPGAWALLAVALCSGAAALALAMAMAILVALYPESVLEPGFQMSFAATAALVAAFEAHAAREATRLPSPGLLIGSLQGLARAGGAVLLTSLVAGLATDPFALFHFQRFAAYGLVANLAIAPIVTFVVAPAAALAAVLAPFGRADIPLSWMSGALALISDIGGAFGARPEAIAAAPRPPDLFLALSSLAVAWTCLWRGALRWGGAVIFAAALAHYAAAPRPVLAFDGELRAVFVRASGDGDWRLVARVGRSTFARDRIGQQLGLSPQRATRLAEPESCTEEHCLWLTPRGRALAVVFDPAALDAACSRADVVVTNTRGQALKKCKPGMLIDGAALAREGGRFIYETPSGVVLRAARPAALVKPWTTFAEP
jgi:competence protein ComEC